MRGASLVPNRILTSAPTGPSSGLLFLNLLPLNPASSHFPIAVYFEPNENNQSGGEIP